MTHEPNNKYEEIKQLYKDEVLNKTVEIKNPDYIPDDELFQKVYDRIKSAPEFWKTFQNYINARMELEHLPKSTNDYTIFTEITFEDDGEINYTNEITNSYGELLAYNEKRRLQSMSIPSGLLATPYEDKPKRRWWHMLMFWRR